jgi:hypothetical protein
LQYLYLHFKPLYFMFRTTLLFIAVLLSLFTTAQTEPQAVLQHCLAAPELKQMLPLNTNGEFLPFAIITNNHIPANLNIYKSGTKVKLYTTKKEMDADGFTGAYFIMQEADMHETRANIYLQYKLDVYKFKVFRYEGDWKFHSMKKEK